MEYLIISCADDPELRCDEEVSEQEWYQTLEWAEYNADHAKYYCERTNQNILYIY